MIKVEDFIRLLKGVELAIQLKSYPNGVLLYGFFITWGEDLMIIWSQNEKRILFIRLEDISWFSVDSSYLSSLLEELKK